MLRISATSVMICGVSGRLAWIQVARGEVQVNGQMLREGDGLAVDEPGRLRLHDARVAEVLLFDLSGSWRAA